MSALPRIQDDQSAPSLAPSDLDAPDSSRLDALWHSLRYSSVDQARRLGEALVERGLLTRHQLSQALALQARTPPHRTLGSVLVDNKILRPEQISHVMGEWLGLRFVDLHAIRPEAEALHLVPAEYSERESVLPLMVREGTLVVAVADPWDNKAILDELRFRTNLRVLPVAGVAGTLAPAIARAYLHTASAAPVSAQRSLQELTAELAQNDDLVVMNDIASASDSKSVLVQFVNRLIANAIKLRASDIHIETCAAPKPVKIRLRIDGDLSDYLELPGRHSLAIVSRLKIMADLDISEHRKPQDGKIDFARFGGDHVELRMVTVPTAHGLEDVVLRLLSGLKPMPLEGIDLSARNLAGLRAVMQKPYGLILICGPTGSGKTTTLHSVMRDLNTGKRKIWTAEDPVEITQEGLRQVQINARIGWTFAAAMRTFLRADPDVIMIGEMRDEETARIAIEASLTGHLVMSTLHTNSAAESITRLLEIGMDPFTFSDSLLAIAAQRLVRRLCTECRIRERLQSIELDYLADLHIKSGGGSGIDRRALIARWAETHGDPEGHLWRYRRQGCAKCDGTGYHGRLGLHELLVADERLRELIRRRAPALDIVALGQSTGMITLRQDGIEKMFAGLTDLSDVMAATNQ
ncbi:MAG: Flp pilus assembly complex ATPase component TadA [Proteobacteria bacterium]|nr:Flp pilus assembly complex ATPase component TadA [Pseudomonadota bacterium]